MQGRGLAAIARYAERPMTPQMRLHQLERNKNPLGSPDKSGYNRPSFDLQRLYTMNPHLIALITGIIAGLSTFALLFKKKRHSDCPA